MGRRNNIAKPISSLKGGTTLAPALVPQLSSGQQSVPSSSSSSSVPSSSSMPSMPSMPAPMSGGMDPFSNTIIWLQTNPYLVGSLMLLLNLGGRFLALELTKKQEAFLQAPWIRPFIFFTVIFVATRNLVAAFWITLLFFFIIWVAANENSPFCMIPSWCGHDTQTPADLYESNIAALK
jgi:hypothetical protein